MTDYNIGDGTTAFSRGFRDIDQYDVVTPGQPASNCPTIEDIIENPTAAEQTALNNYAAANPPEEVLTTEDYINYRKCPCTIISERNDFGADPYCPILLPQTWERDDPLMEDNNRRGINHRLLMDPDGQLRFCSPSRPGIDTPLFQIPYWYPSEVPLDRLPPITFDLFVSNKTGQNVSARTIDLPTGCQFPSLVKPIRHEINMAAVELEFENCPVPDPPEGVLGEGSGIAYGELLIGVWNYIPFTISTTTDRIARRPNDFQWSIKNVRTNLPRGFEFNYLNTSDLIARGMECFADDGEELNVGTLVPSPVIYADSMDSLNDAAKYPIALRHEEWFRQADTLEVEPVSYTQRYFRIPRFVWESNRETRPRMFVTDPYAECRTGDDANGIVTNFSGNFTYTFNTNYHLCNVCFTFPNWNPESNFCYIRSFRGLTLLEPLL